MKKDKDIDKDTDYGNPQYDLVIAGAGLLGLTALHEILLALSNHDKTHYFKDKNGRPLNILIIDGGQTCLESSRYSLAVSAMRSARTNAQSFTDLNGDSKNQYSIHELGLEANWRMAMDKTPGVYPAILWHDKDRGRFQKYNFIESINEVIAQPEFNNLSDHPLFISAIKDSKMFSYCEKAIYFHSETYLDYLLSDIKRICTENSNQIRLKIIKNRIVKYSKVNNGPLITLADGQNVKSSFFIWATGVFQLGNLLGSERIKVKEKPLKIKKVFGQFLKAPMLENLLLDQKINIPFWEIEHDSFKIVYNNIDKQIYIGTFDYDENPNLEIDCLLPNVSKLKELHKRCEDYLAPLKINLPSFSRFSPVAGVRAKGPKGQPYCQEIPPYNVMEDNQYSNAEFALLAPYKNGFTLHRPLGKQAAQWFLKKILS